MAHRQLATGGRAGGWEPQPATARTTTAGTARNRDINGGSCLRQRSTPRVCSPRRTSATRSAAESSGAIVGARDIVELAVHLTCGRIARTACRARACAQQHWVQARRVLGRRRAAGHCRTAVLATLVQNSRCTRATPHHHAASGCGDSAPPCPAEEARRDGTFVRCAHRRGSCRGVRPLGSRRCRPRSTMRWNW